MNKKIEFFANKDDAFERAIQLTRNYIVYEASNYGEGNEGVFAVMEQKYFFENMQREGYSWRKI